MGCLRERIFPVGKVVSLSDLPELRGMSETAEGGLRIGALTSLRTVAEHPLVLQALPRPGAGGRGGRQPAAAQPGDDRRATSARSRAAGTTGRTSPACRKGGDTCFAVDGENQFHCIFGGGGTCFIVHPSDTAPALTAFNATARVAGPKGVRNVPLDKFFVLPEVDVQRETVLARGEIVTEIRIPPPGPGTRSSYRKVRARRSWDFALAGVALTLRFDGRRVVGGRVVLSGAAPVPWRSTAVEQVVRGKELTADVMAAAAKAVTAGAEPLEKNDYKIPLFQGLIEEELTRLAAAG